MEEVITAAIGIIIFLTMMVIGMDLTRDKFRDLLRRPRALVVGFLGQLLLVPAALGIVLLMKPPEHIANGILLVAVCPTANMTSLWTYLARVNVALSVSLSILTSLATFITMPAWMAVYGWVFHEDFRFPVPASLLIVRLFALLAVPITIGMFLRARFPAFEAKHRRGMRNFTLVGIVLLGAYIIASETNRFTSDMGVIALYAVVITLVGGVLGVVLGALTRLPARDTLSLMLVFPVRNLGIAIFIAVTIFRETEFAVFATALFITQLPLQVAAASLIRRYGPGRILGPA